MAIRPADFVLVFRTVNIDEAIARARVTFFRSVEPKNSRRNEIFGLGQRIVGPERDASFKNCSGRGVVADFLRNAKFSERRFHAALFRTQTEAGTRYRVRSQCFIAAL